MASLQTAVENLKKHGFDARAFETGEEAAAAALELIGSRSVGFGGSVTLRDLGIYPRLKAQGNTAWFAKQVYPDDWQRTARSYRVCGAVFVKVGAVPEPFVFQKRRKN